MVVCYTDSPTSGEIVSVCLGNIVHFCMFTFLRDRDYFASKKGAKFCYQAVCMFVSPYTYVKSYMSRHSGVTSHRQHQQCREAQGPKTVKGAQSDPNYVSRLLARSECLPGAQNYSYVTVQTLRNFLCI